MRLKDCLGLTLATAAILLFSLGHLLLGRDGRLACAVLLAAGLALIWSARRDRRIEEAMDEFPARRDGDYLAGLHDADLPDHD